MKDKAFAKKSDSFFDLIREVGELKLFVLVEKERIISTNITNLSKPTIERLDDLSEVVQHLIREMLNDFYPEHNEGYFRLDIIREGSIGISARLIDIKEEKQVSNG